MAKRILVPLDKAETSEAVLPLVASVASATGATVRLLHVAPYPTEVVDDQGRVLAYTDQETTRLTTDGIDYLAGAAALLPFGHAESVVRFGDAVAEILREADAFGADLIVVTTTGRSGVGRVLLGSVAELVFRRAHVPVLLYHNGPPGR